MGRLYGGPGCCAMEQEQEAGSLAPSFKQGDGRGWLRWSAHRLGGALCRDHVQYPAFAPGTSQLGLDLFVSCCHNFPQLHIVIIFNLLQLSRVPGPNLSLYNLRQWSFSAWFTP